MLKTFTNRLDPDQAGRNVGPDLKYNCLTLMVFFNPLLHRLFLNNIEKFQEKFKLSFEFFCKNAPFSIIFSNM